ncbi:MAG: YesL family protein [Lachnospiraceae bacterium]|nr:YesL family protein [Lachnospiraceae bacterium]
MNSNGFFSIESPFYKLMVKLLDIIKLNFMWMLFSIPIVTIGAATTAAFYTGFRIDKDEDAYIAAPFIREFKANFKQGCIIGIIQLVIIYIIYIDFQLSAAAGERRLVYMAAGIVAVFLAFLHFIYVYALLARYDNTIINTFRNSFSVCIKFFPKTIGLLLLVLAESAIFLWNITTMFVGFFIGPACIILTICKVVMPMFKKIEEENAANKDKDK